MANRSLFKWINQNLKIKAPNGTSKNAVLIQVWTAWIVYLWLVWLKLKSKVGRGLLAFSHLAPIMLLDRLNLWDMLSARPPDHQEPVLFNFFAEQ